MAGQWIARQHGEVAVEAILDAAERLFTRNDLTSVSMVDVAAEANCSRPTVYRYFESRHALMAAYLQRQVTRMIPQLQQAVAGQDVGAAALGIVLVRAVELVRESPPMLAWFASESTALALELACSNAEVLRLADEFAVGGGSVDTTVDKVEWAARAIISLAIAPHGDHAKELDFIRRFVVPVLLT
ncbi:TetR/AcrR family transcriptional regulator [Mycobacterium sp. CBMA271]|uniref:TetR/AcrR family transcriptional regulator n=1 Tax=unclassified Mycobacteroides TaxID=2618759 RepID=UPI0012DC451B|nr:MULTISPECIES: TetR/AcrR family transcriptional regulator [unclassified Mycobacteroides]MUM19600.1 hypothetical protein [Mycobacteroides sp. CBMA 326]MUM24202.1 TetR/AcrR family transcriptional regulator [Mycobacteroides sp. CBMA 271]